MAMINKKYHNIHHSFIPFQFHNYVAALHMSCFSYNVLPLKICQMSFVTTGQPMAILGNYHLNHVPHLMLTAPLFMLPPVLHAMHVQGKQDVSFSMDANNCLSFRAADTSSSSHCKHTCAEKIYSKIIYKSSYYLHCIALKKKAKNIYDRKKYRIFQFSATYTDYN